MNNPNEATTRQELIDPALQKAGWDVTDPEQVRIEIPVDGFDPQAWQRLESKLKRLRAQQRESTRQAEHLFQSLLERAFKGEN